MHAVKPAGKAWVIFSVMVVLVATAGAATSTTDSAKILTLLEAVGEDYREALENGAIVRPIEYEEAKGFLEEAQLRWRNRGVNEQPDSEISASLEKIGQSIVSLADPSSVAALVAKARQDIMVRTGAQAEVFPAEPASANRGRALFLENCSACHGVEGNGQGPNSAKLNPKPANFTDSSFMRGETPYDFFHVVTLGKRNSAMPAWGDVLSVQERWDLIAYIWTLAHGEAHLAEGQGIFLSQCGGCHGANGNGQGALAAGLLKPAPDLTKMAETTRLRDLELFQATTSGVSGSPMPSFERMLNDDERWKVVGFLRFLSLGGGPPNGGAADSGDATARGTRIGKLARLVGRSYATALGADAEIAARARTQAEILVQQLADSVHVLRGGKDSAELGSLSESVAELKALVTDGAPIATVSPVVETVAQRAEAMFPAIQPDASSAASTSAVDKSLNESLQILDRIASAYARQDPQSSGLASDAYFAFEPLEPQLNKIAPSIKTGVEEHFLNLRLALKKANAAAEVEAIVDAIRQDYEHARKALMPQASTTGLLLQSAGILLREGFEIVLVIGMLLGYVVKSGHPELRRLVQAGVVAGIAASFATAFAFGELLRRNPGSSSLLEGLTMLLASGVLFWVSYWLVSKAEADKWQKFIRSRVNDAIAGRRQFALMGAAFLAVYREGFETVLFYQALYASAPSGTSTITVGISVGLISLAVVYWMFRRFQGRIPMAKFFMATGIFLYVMAATFASQGVHEFQEIGLVSVTPLEWMPTLPLLGCFPSIETTAVQGAFLLLMIYAWWRMRRAASLLQAKQAPSSPEGELTDLRRAVREMRDVLATSPAAPQALRQSEALIGKLEALCGRLEKLGGASKSSELHA